VKEGLNHGKMPTRLRTETRRKDEPGGTDNPGR